MQFLEKKEKGSQIYHIKGQRKDKTSGEDKQIVKATGKKFKEK